MSNRTAARVNLVTLSADWESIMIPSREFRTATLTLIASSSFSWTIKFYAANVVDWVTAPDLSTAAWEWNEYAVVRSIDLQDGSPIDWNTWVAFAWVSDWVSRYEINDNNNDFVWIKISWYTAWTIKVELGLVNNQ